MRIQDDTPNFDTIAMSSRYNFVLAQVAVEHMLYMCYFVLGLLSMGTLITAVERKVRGTEVNSPLWLATRHKFDRVLNKDYQWTVFFTFCFRGL
jgi:hypothetical protein